jgi:hypothetical protein
MVRCTILLILVFFCVLCVCGEQQHSKNKHGGQVGKGRPGNGEHAGKGKLHHSGEKGGQKGPRKHHIKKKLPRVGPPRPKVICYSQKMS